MAKRRTRAEMREEFLKLLDVFDYLDLNNPEEDSEVATHQPKEMTKESILADFDAQRPWSHFGDMPEFRGSKWSASMHLQGLQDAVNDSIYFVLEAIADEDNTGPTYWTTLPETYAAATGRDLFADAGNPMGRIKSILKRGSVRTEEEWRLLNEIVCNLDSCILTQPQVRKAEQLMSEYELKVQAEFKK
ncbi:MAG: hypothetical protein ABJH45_02790 [Paracoccaceae bacterium]